MKILGFDIGSSSIGWSLRDDDNTFQTGVVTFKSGMQKGGSKGYESPTANRREARAKRKLLDSRKNRKVELLRTLLDEYVPLTATELDRWAKYVKGKPQVFPQNPDFIKWIKCDFTYLGIKKIYKNPYELRIEACKPGNKLHKHEIGRALYHIVQRRGYKDIGDRDKETEKQIARRSENGFDRALEAKNATVASVLKEEFLDKGMRARGQYPYRKEYEIELRTILKAQGYKLPDEYNKNEGEVEFAKKVFKAILWQKPLKTQKGNIGKCTLEPNHLRCPLSNPVFEVFRAWQFINTIRYFDDNGQKVKLTDEERELVFEILLKKDSNFKFEEIRKRLDKHFKKERVYNYPVSRIGKYDTSVAGMPVCKALISLFGEGIKSSLRLLHLYHIGDAPKIIGGYSIYDLWHILFCFDEKRSPNPNYLEEFAQVRLAIKTTINKKGKEENPFAELKRVINKGYADLSLKAMRKIIPFLEQGYLYNEAVLLAKIPELLEGDWDESENIVKNCFALANKEYKSKKIVVEIANTLIDRYKGLSFSEKFAFKDFQYTLDSSDIEEVKITCQKYFGEKTWHTKPDEEKNSVLSNVCEAYQAFFHDIKRAYRKVLTLNEMFISSLKSHGIELKGALYHHSDIENRFLKRCINPKTGVVQLPKYIDPKTGFITDLLPEARIDSIKNPMFNKAMACLRKLVNELLKQGLVDEDTEIVIELANELNDNNMRAAIEKFQKERESIRQKFRQFVIEFQKNQNLSFDVDSGIMKIELWAEQMFESTEDENGKPVNNPRNFTDLLKVKDAEERYSLWFEQYGQCMYTGKMISISQLFSRDVDIDHTIPRRMFPDNTMANKTIAFKEYNEKLKRGELLPSQCPNFDKDVEGWGTCIKKRLENWIERCERFRENFLKHLQPRPNEDENARNERIVKKHYYRMKWEYWREKLERFNTNEVREGWARRQLVDTQTISKYAREFLKTYFKKVSVERGNLTAEFRKMYGFQIGSQKDRSKHYHHAVDATILTLIPRNSSHKLRVLEEFYDREEKGLSHMPELPFKGFAAKRIVDEIEKSTRVVNLDTDKILKQTFKKQRVRGKIQYMRDKNSQYLQDTSGNRIPFVSHGDTVRSNLFAQTYLGKIRNVVRDENGKPLRKAGDWEYQTGKSEFSFVVREDIQEVRSSKKLIEAIVDPVLRKHIDSQKGNDVIYDFQGNPIRHVRVYSSVGREVKERLVYLSKHEYKNKFYSEAGSIPYAILLERAEPDSRRELIIFPSFEVAKIFKEFGAFNLDNALRFKGEQTGKSYSDVKSLKLLKTGQRAIVIKSEEETENRFDTQFLTNRLYIFEKFSEDYIWMRHQLEARSTDGIKDDIKSIKDEMLRSIEEKLGIGPIEEDFSITDARRRKKDLDDRRYRFSTLKSFRFERLLEHLGIEEVKKIKSELDAFKAIPSTIEIDGNTPLLKVHAKNCNILIESIDFEISILGQIKWLK